MDQPKLRSRKTYGLAVEVGDVPEDVKELFMESRSGAVALCEAFVLIALGANSQGVFETIDVVTQDGRGHDLEKGEKKLRGKPMRPEDVFIAWLHLGSMLNLSPFAPEAIKGFCGHSLGAFQVAADAEQFPEKGLPPILFALRKFLEKNPLKFSVIKGAEK